MYRVGLLSVLVASLSTPLLAQAPTGTIAGTITDQVNAVLPKASVTITNKDTGNSRVIQTASDGSFQVPSLAPGMYDVIVEAPGFQPVVSPVEVVTGQTTTVRLTLQVSTRTEAVTVTGVSPMVQLESNTVQGVVGRSQIETLPLNGRSFLNLAQLQPGVTVSLANPAQFNAQFSVSVMGAPASRTAITVDGGNVRNPIEGGTGQNFSQEVVQEFQISTTNFDLSTGIAGFESSPAKPPVIVPMKKKKTGGIANVHRRVSRWRSMIQRSFRATKRAAARKLTWPTPGAGERRAIRGPSTAPRRRRPTSRGRSAPAPRP